MGSGERNDVGAGGFPPSSGTITIYFTFVIHSLNTTEIKLVDLEEVYYHENLAFFCRVVDIIIESIVF